MDEEQFTEAERRLWVVKIWTRCSRSSGTKLKGKVGVR
jgi:hypothetical protein